MEKRQLVIIGGGPAGLTSAIYGRRAGLDVLVLEKGSFGGQITITDEIENWPGVKKATGQELATSLREHAEVFKPEFRDCSVTGIHIKDGHKIITTNKGDIQADAVIIASGANFKKAGCPGELEFIGKGVSYCAVCDGAFFEELEVAVIGGGNTAVEEAVYLTQFASKVYIIHRRDSFRADKIPVDRAMANPKIVPVWDSVVESIVGSDMVDKLVLKNVKTGEISDLPVSGVFVFIGTEPNIEFLGDLVEKRGGWIKTNEKMETSVEGILAAGDVRDKYLRQVVTAAADGAIAAMSAYDYITAELYLQSALFEPKSAVALVTSSIDEKQIHLASAVEAWLKESGKSMVFIDGYRNARMKEKLGVTALPSLVRLEKGEITEIKAAPDLAAVKAFCS
ncbi:MAG: thioredoxin-disulfide reductase [Synergistaceae bacterium]|nr:thioredoxin-disulfide reductase [Synergistaceae bacterium]MBP9625729.1 thioredoxin-disulfide reductase [Synergistaceae bacterium]MBP9957048.1 thioredoxin-disulfide reductase [Synergistaceae bacterium]